MTPSACSTSAAPDFDDSARLPCLATGTPAPATMNAAQVEILYEPEASPPVPTTSMASGGAFTPQHLGAHGRDRAGDFIDGFAAHAQRHQQAAHLRRRCFARHHAVEGGGGLLAREACAGRDLGDERFEIVGHGASQPREYAADLRAVPGCVRVWRSRRGKIEKILQHQVAVLGGDAFGMKLHAVHGQASRASAHHETVVGFGIDVRSRQACCALDHQRMIARRLERPVDAAEDAVYRRA